MVRETVDLNFLVALNLYGLFYEFHKDRVRILYSAFQLRVKLNTNKEGVLWYFDDFGQTRFRVGAGQHHAVLFEGSGVFVVELVAVSVSFADLAFTVNARCK